MGSFDGRLLVLATTFATRDQAETMVAGLVSDGLAVCGQVGANLTSFYRWQDKVECDAEVGVTLKIRDDRFTACLERLRDIHPYDVPQLIAWPASFVDDAYGRWAWELES